MPISKHLSLTLLFCLVSTQLSAIEEVSVIGTRLDLGSVNQPANVDSVSAAQLSTLQAIHIQQALNKIPGVNYHRGNGQESLPAIRSAVLTGAGACGNVLVMEELIAVRSSGFCNVNELFDTHFEQAGNIEVLKGGATAFYGSNALLGAINVSLPVLDENRASIEVGSNAHLRAKAALSYGQGKAHQGTVYITLSEDGGYQFESGYEQQKVSWRQQGQVGGWQYRSGATITHLDQETAGFIVGEDVYLDEQLRRENPNPEAFRESSSLRLWSQFKQANSDRFWQITPYVRVTDMDFLQHFLPGDPLEQNQQVAAGTQTAYWNTTHEKLQWAIGVDAELARGELIQSQDQPTQGSAFLVETIPVGIHYDYEVDSRQAAAFAHLDWQANDVIGVRVGVRLEYIEYDYRNRSLTGRTRDDGTQCGFGGCRYSRPASRTDDFSNLSPKLEIQYQPNSRWSGYLNVAQNFRAPQATELYRLQREQDIASLDNVEATHVELGVKWQGERSSAHLAYYDSRQSNVIIRDSDFFNVDGQRLASRGLEARWSMALSKTLTWDLSASFADHEYDSDQFIGDVNIRDNQVDTAPEQVINTSLRWQASERFASELEIQHVSDYFLEPQNRFQYPGHTISNLRLNYRYSDTTDLSLRVLNITDRLYAERADYTGFTGERYFPGLPRSFYASINWSF